MIGTVRVACCKAAVVGPTPATITSKPPPPRPPHLCARSARSPLLQRVSIRKLRPKQPTRFRLAQPVVYINMPTRRTRSCARAAAATLGKPGLDGCKAGCTMGAIIIDPQEIVPYGGIELRQREPRWGGGVSLAEIAWEFGETFRMQGPEKPLNLPSALRPSDSRNRPVGNGGLPRPARDACW